MKLPRIDLAYAIVLGALAAEMPLMVGAILTAKRVDVPDHWFFGELVGGGLALVSLLGNARILQAATEPGLSKGLRWIYVGSWGIVFVAVMWVLPIYLLSVNTGLSIQKTMALLGEPEGRLLWSWFVGVVGIVHVAVPPLMVISGRARVAEAEEEAKKEATEHDRLVSVDQALDVAKGPTQTRIVAAISAYGPMTVGGLHEHLPDIKTSQTVRSNAETLKEKGRLAYVLGSDPRQYELAQQAIS